MIGIYKIVSPSGRIYIGQSVDINKRWKTYIDYQNFGFQVRLKNSVLKYGIENHKFEIIELCKIEELNNRERHWQDFFNCLDTGLNCRLTTSSSKSGKLSDDTKHKISHSNKGISRGPMTEQAKKKISEYRKGKKHSDLSKEKTSKAVSKPVLLYTVEGEFIREFSSMLEAKNHFSTSYSVIINNIKGKSKTTKYGLWKLK